MEVSRRAVREGSIAAMFRSLRAHDSRRGHVADVWRSHLPHRQGQLVSQDFEHALDAFLAERREAPDARTPDSNAARSRGERLVDVA